MLLLERQPQENCYFVLHTQGFESMSVLTYIYFYSNHGNKTCLRQLWHDVV
jgi:hypothetical protein